ncbi:MAG: uroporphyrinogen-III synthase [Terracidiphilus sp.]|jgi:uroporphyrinogen-III synthase
MTALPLAGHRALEGKRVLVTRALHQAGKLSDALRDLGAEPVEVPVLEICPPENFAPLDAALGNLDQYDWLIFTSANAVRSVAGRAQEQGITLLPAKGQRVAAVGRATAAAIEQIGLNVELVPDSYVAESLVVVLAPQIAGKRVLLARAAIARDVIPDALRAAGALIDVVDAYRNVLPAAAPELLRAALEKGIDAATFTSSSSVTHLADAARAGAIAFPLAGVRAISIGPITSQTLREFGWEPAAEATVSDVPGLIAAVEQALRA